MTPRNNVGVPFILQTDQQHCHCRPRNPDRCFDRSKLVIAIHAPRGARSRRMEASHCREHQTPSRCCSSFVERQRKWSADWMRRGTVESRRCTRRSCMGFPFRRAFVAHFPPHRSGWRKLEMLLFFLLLLLFKS